MPLVGHNSEMDLDILMDAEPTLTDNSTIDEQLVGYASNLSLTQPQRPQAFDLRAVLLAHGASPLQAEQYTNPNSQFLPFISRFITTPKPLCKACGKFHGAHVPCGRNSLAQWKNTIQATGWSGAFKAMVSFLASC